MRKTVKLLASFALALILLLALLPGGAHAADTVDSGTCGDNLTWTLDSDGVLTISGTGAMTDTPWRGEHMDQITKAVISNGVTNIGDGAFAFCTAMTSITIPDSVTSIGDSAFAKCFALESITIPSSVTSIGGGAFERCWTIESLNIPSSVKTIGAGAFFGLYGLTNLTIASGVTMIGDYAFNYCSGLTSATIPKSVTTIGNAPFCNCSSLTEINVASGNTRYCSVNGVLFNKAKTELIDYPSGRQGAYAIPTGVTTIGDSSFSSCTGLTGITIPSGVTSIEAGAFYCCENLTSVTIPAGVTAIEGNAFSVCKNLTSITIPSTVTSIGDEAFYSCESLTSVTIPAGVTSIGERTFQGCESLTSITIPGSVTSLGDFAFSGCSSLMSVTIPDSVTSIGNYAFSGCSSLTKTTIPASVTTIGNAAFYKCSALTDVYYGGSQAQWAQITIKNSNDSLTGATIHFVPVITTQPKSMTADAGSTASFKVVATGAESYQWYYRTSSTGSWTKVSAASGKTANYSLTTAAQHNGYQYRCLVKNASGEVYTNTVTLTVNSKPVITTQPKNYVGAIGSTATATVTATGEGLTYQWYFANPGATSFTKSGSKTATYSATLTASNSGRRLYCVITDAYGNTVKTNTVTMTAAADPVSITTQPKNYVGAVGSTATATVKATGEGLSYQWYFANPGATSFTKSGSKTATYSATLTATNSGRRMYCVITDANGNTVTTNTVTMTASLSITTQPKNYVGAVGSTATATVKATGEGLSYQWYFANPGATNFTKSGSKTATYSATLTAANSGRQMYCVITDASGNSVRTNTVTMTAEAAPITITTQPKNYVGAVGSTATATVKATGEGLSYQWYFANPGATSFTKSGSKTATYSATLTASNSGRRFYCVITDANGNSVTTNTVTMTAEAAPITITTQPKNYVGTVGSTATATVVATGESLSYQWYFANPGATSFTKSGSKTATYSATLTATNSGRRMYCVITDAGGNSVRTNTVIMTVG